MSHVQTGLEAHVKPDGEGVKIVSNFNISNWQLLDVAVAEQ